LNNLTIGRLRERLQAWFPEREFFMRSAGQVRFIKLTTRAQTAAAAMTIGVMGLMGASAGAITAGQYFTELEREALLKREAEVASAASGVAAYRNEMREVTRDLERRQVFLEEVAEMLPPVDEDETTEKGAEETSPRKVSASLPGANGLSRIEARQLALVEKFTKFAEARAERAEGAIRKLGLNPRTILASGRVGQGGPLEKLSTERDGSIDPRFERLGDSLARMAALERGLTSIPQVMPADMRMISSGFGYRSDPFTGEAALHSGLDFRGQTGAPIHAAAKGRVSFVGAKSGYGNVVEISHGNGMMTRYAHMSRARASVGQEVAAGDVIGAIGSTGRSTGPHLHFEVRINDRAVNPRPFLQAGS
jgi:murein DD-endopeptidase MepM/ murein hydrolase activator NlpD